MLLLLKNIFLLFFTELAPPGSAEVSCQEAGPDPSFLEEVQEHPL